MERRGYGQEYINRYKMMARFHHQRVPLVILVCGTACVGKSTIATQLGQRLNLPNVLQTDMVYELLRTSTYSSKELITKVCRECRIVRKGLADDFKIAMKDGKPIIIEGMHIDPSIYLMDEENKSPHKASKIDENELKDTENNAEISKTEAIGEELDKVSDGVKSVHIVDQAAGALLEEWISSRKFSDKYPIQEKDKVINNLKTIQDYLCSFKSHGLTVVNISATTFPQTLDWLHNHLLQCIEQGILDASKGSSNQTNRWKLRVQIN
ncbi:hypothetical protein Lser_V15G04276 [Lactuca serriola]